jgi:lipopolysaccharide biosynthesis regulator YciM
MPAPWLLALLATTALALLFALGAVLLRKGRTEDEARAYLAGVRYVLLDDPDGAIAELSKAAQLNAHTYDTYFALAELFRRKGEHARAIRLNQNILLRRGVPEEARRRARVELAEDYRQSGLKDEAVEAFEQLLRADPDQVEIRVKYRQLLEEGRDFARAIDVQEQLVGRSGALDPAQQGVLANLYAERARQLSSEDMAEARRYAELAVKARPGSANAQLALAQVALAQEGSLQASSHSTGRTALGEAIAHEPELAATALAELTRVHGSEAQVQGWLGGHRPAEAKAAAPFELAQARCHIRAGELDEGLVLLRGLLDRFPHDWAARKELSQALRAQEASEGLGRTYAELLGALEEPVLGFACRSCGQKHTEHAFRCAVCGAWDRVSRLEPVA